MPLTPNQCPLPFATHEVNAIDHILPTSIKRVLLHCPDKARVLEIIRQCSVVHFACHGEADPDPLKTKFLFSDWENDPLSVDDIMRTNLKEAELAYISACHTAINRNLLLLDEAIHIAGAFHLAGFPTVIGTMWQISDMNSPTVAEGIYRAMLSKNKLDVRKAGHVLHFVTRKIRDESQIKRGSRRLDDPMTWAPYIHIGL
jgi:CHAT domain-containing protein